MVLFSLLVLLSLRKGSLVGGVTLSGVAESQAHYRNLRWYFLFVINAFWLWHVTGC